MILTLSVQATAAAAASEVAESERQEANRIKKKEGIPHDIPFACQGSGLRARLGNTGKICRFFLAQSTF